MKLWLLPILKEIEVAKTVNEKKAREAKEELETATRKYEKYMELSNNLGARRSDLENTRKRREEKERELGDLPIKKKRLEGIANKEAQYFEFREKKEEFDAMREKYQRKQELLKREEKTQVEINKREGEIRGLEEKRIEFEGVEERVEEVKRGIDEIRKEKERLHGAFKSRAIQIKGDIEESKEKKKKIDDLVPLMMIISISYIIYTLSENLFFNNYKNVSIVIPHWVR